MKFLERIEKRYSEFLEEINLVHTEENLEKIRVKYTGRKGILQSLFKELADLPVKEKPFCGKRLNEIKRSIQNLLAERRVAIEKKEPDERLEIDFTLPGRRPLIGRKHPLTQVLNEIKNIFIHMGFSVETGPEVETDYYNFEALNIPKDHPARDMQDTFYLGGDIVLRTHTSPVQIRVMEKRKPPVKIISPGRVYRNEAISARSYCLFHQVEGLYVDEGVTFAELKGTLTLFARQFYREDVQVRFRPSFFPFTEPSAEMDISCIICNGKGCKVCKYTGWLEILGSGMVDPNVFEYVGYDSEKYTGYAFGMGIERIAMQKYGIDDIRIFFENDMRFLQQF